MPHKGSRKAKPRRSTTVEGAKPSEQAPPATPATSRLPLNGASASGGGGGSTPGLALRLAPPKPPQRTPSSQPQSTQSTMARLPQVSKPKSFSSTSAKEMYPRDSSVFPNKYPESTTPGESSHRISNIGSDESYQHRGFSHHIAQNPLQNRFREAFDPKEHKRWWCGHCHEGPHHSRFDNVCNYCWCLRNNNAHGSKQVPYPFREAFNPSKHTRWWYGHCHGGSYDAKSDTECSLCETMLKEMAYGLKNDR